MTDSTAPAPPGPESGYAWPDLLAALLRGEDVPGPAAAWAMGQVMAGEATPVQVAGFLVALRAKGETAAEVAGLVTAMLAAAVPLDIAGPALDVVGTGGDRAHTVNISTMAAIVAAGAGARVVKHGNRAASSQTGTADVLEQLGVVIALPPDAVRACVDTAGIGFCFAAAYHPAMRHAAAPRRELGVPTVFNILGPLANPAQPSAALIGCADARLAPVMAQVLADRGVRALVVRGDDGLDEITTASTTTVWDTTTGDGVVRHDRLDPVALGLSPATVADLRGGDAQTNAEVLRRVVAGHDTLPAVTDAVLVNAAAALVAWDAATAAHAYGSPGVCVAQRVAAALPVARAAIADGAAARVLAEWIRVCAEVAPPN